MSEISIVKADSFFLQEIETAPIEFDKQDYMLRIDLLLDKMKQQNITHAFIFGDREHFSNIEYFSGYDCRFEEGALVISADGKADIIVGNEGVSYSYKIPYEINRHLYQNFSLQGQMRDKLVDLKQILKDIGIGKDSKVGVVGYKYFETEQFGDSSYIFDIPSYVLKDLQKVVNTENVINFTSAVTGLPDGVRMKLHTAKEIAWAESAGNIVANAVVRMLKAMKPGLDAREVSAKAAAPMDAISVFPMINFGEKQIAYGLGSPNTHKLELGEVCGVCYAVRGNLTSRLGIAAYDLQSCNEDLQEHAQGFYKRHWQAMANWYETIGLGVAGGKLHDAVHNTPGIDENGIYLNCGHNVGTDEWSNAPVYKGSEIEMYDGIHLEVDIISSRSEPTRVAICEDAIVLASAKLRAELKEQYPEAYERIVLRQQKMREVLGINIKDEVLPLSNLNAVYFPYMLNLGQVFAKL